MDLFHNTMWKIVTKRSSQKIYLPWYKKKALEELIWEAVRTIKRNALTMENSDFLVSAYAPNVVMCIDAFIEKRLMEDVKIFGNAALGSQKGRKSVMRDKYLKQNFKWWQ